MTTSFGASDYEGIVEQAFKDNGLESTRLDSFSVAFTKEDVETANQVLAAAE